MGDHIVRKLFTVWVKYFFVFNLLVLTACGGGGGGGGPSYSLSVNSLTFSAASATDPTPSTKTFDITVNSGTVYLAVLYTNNGISNVTTTSTSANTVQVTVSPAAPSTLGVSTQIDTISVYGCSDVNCNAQISGSPKTVNVTYTIDGMTASPANINLAAAVNSTSSTVQSTISNSLGTASWSSSITYFGTTGSWLTLSPGNGSSLPASIGFTANGLTTPPGTYTANVNLTSGSSTLTIPVSYVVSNSLTPSSTLLSYTINNSPSASDLTRQFSPGAYTGVTWTASSDVTWLDVSPASGSTANVTASLNQTQLNTLFNGTYNGTITIVPSVGNNATVPVTLTVDRTQVNYVAPYVATSNTTDDVIIRGENLNQSTVLNVKFGNTNASSFSVISATEITATHPTLTAGNYSTTIETALGTHKTLATLVVVDAPTYTATNIMYPNATTKKPLDIIYDAERQALIVAVAYPSEGSGGAVLRYPYSSSSWSSTPGSASILEFRNIGLTIDGQQLLALTNTAITQLDPTTLISGTSTSGPFSSFNYLKNAAFANNGNVILTTGVNGSGYSTSYQYSARNPAFTSFSSFYFGTPGASMDGSNVTIVQGSLSPAPSVSKYLASSDALTISGIALNQYSGIPPELDRTASRIVLNGYLVYDSGYALLGNLPVASRQAAVVLSPDGNRAYRYDSGTTLQTYDLTATPVAGVFPEIGAGTTLSANPGTSPKITISPDGGTLFIAGADSIVVLPTP